MNYSADVIKRAYDELNRRRETARAVKAAREEEIRDRLPEAYSVYRRIVSTKDRLAEAILSKGTDVRAAIERIRDDNLELQKRLREILREKGLPEDYLDMHYSCPICSDSGVSGGNRCQCVDRLLQKYAVEEMNRN